jgi:hypothetical protein
MVHRRVCSIPATVQQSTIAAAIVATVVSRSATSDRDSGSLRHLMAIMFTDRHAHFDDGSFPFRFVERFVCQHQALHFLEIYVRRLRKTQN